ncbi:hypothetical protein MKZ38_006700 [Zalerion maritima]|uniref:TLC domain-containing protein n=1 Tax=Zalerion maritima TaxID=339359 RepID=A0AAD5RIY6_9PEZI|nr:hypothetical protein MKZ38_006700 [Zalerion maritima]
MDLASWTPIGTVAASTAFYHALSRLLTSSDTSPSRRAAVNKGISAGHAAVTAILALHAVASTSRRQEGARNHEEKPSHGSEWLDDSRNPLIQERDHLSNTLTAWEAGYLIYDTLALVLLENGGSYLTGGYSRILDSITKAFQRSPAFMIHHILLASGLVYLQTYIAKQQEKGIRIITALILMNASTPLLHARWWARKTGTPTGTLDVAFVAVFAASRFGPIWWVMQEYGRYHGMSAMEAWKWLRRPCRAGMVGLFGMNAIWWAMLVKGLLIRNQRLRKG